jgi:hypothetical protein
MIKFFHIRSYEMIRLYYFDLIFSLKIFKTAPSFNRPTIKNADFL